ncbi:MAG: cell division protein FtsZ [Calditrichaceae bacterium]|nr:cell division protein FtsZ [Calditrichaceae bacterium]HES58899.1 cell division protein FtsZ [Caldithrix sp.]
MIQFDTSADQTAKIKVVGVGGAGGNAINGMIEAGLTGVEFIVINTDAQDLEKNQASHRIQIGKTLTKGLGAGSNPEVGLHAIEEDKDVVIEVLNGADMVFVTCGMGGGTGTGAAPIVAEIAKDLGALTVAITTMPFTFEGPIRLRNAKKGMEAMRERVDTMLVIPNDRIFSIIEKNTPVIAAFKIADSLLLEATRSISDLINVHGYINLDFADIRTIMAGMGDALMGTGVGIGENRAKVAAEQAITSPLLNDVDISGARGVLINITGGSSLSMHEVGEASTLVQESVGDSANVIFGMVVDEQLTDELRVTVIATGFNHEAQKAQQLQRPKEIPRSEFGAADFSELDKPTFKREHKNVDIEYPATSRQNIFTFPGAEEQDVPEGVDDLDIPTFLRKQMD